VGLRPRALAPHHSPAGCSVSSTSAATKMTKRMSMEDFIAYRLFSDAYSGPSCSVVLTPVAGRNRVVDWAVAFASSARGEVAEATQPRLWTVVGANGAFLGSGEDQCGQHPVQRCRKIEVSVRPCDGQFGSRRWTRPVRPALQHARRGPRLRGRRRGGWCPSRSGPARNNWVTDPPSRNSYNAASAASADGPGPAIASTAELIRSATTRLNAPGRWLRAGGLTVFATPF
jgi:hypothetical protein